MCDVVINIKSTQDSLFEILHIVIYHYIYGGFSKTACLIKRQASHLSASDGSDLKVDKTSHT